MEHDEFKDKLKSAPLFAYQPSALIPPTSGVNAVWLKGETRCLYAGKSANPRRYESA